MPARLSTKALKPSILTKRPRWRIAALRKVEVRSQETTRKKRISLQENFLQCNRLIRLRPR